MPEEPEEGDSRTIFLPESKAEATTPSPEIGKLFPTDEIRDRLDNGEHAVALILTSTKLEVIISQAIRSHYSWNKAKFEGEGYDKYSLGALIEECVEYGALPEYEDKLNKMRSGERQVVSLRNNLVHDYGFLEEIERDEDTQQEVKDAIEKAIDFIESVDI
jgi:hypothetical protein